MQDCLKKVLFRLSVRMLAASVCGGGVMAVAAASSGAGASPAPSSPAPVREAAPASVPQASPPAAPQVRFKPPAGIGAAGKTLAGATRGNVREWVMFVAAPAGPGLSAQAQPILYWYVSRVPGTAPSFMIVESGGEKPLAEVQLPSPQAPGFQSIDFKALGLSLEEGKEYVWQVSLEARPPGAGSAGRVIDALGRIQWQKPGAGLSRWISGGDEIEGAAALAEAGYWYDASARLRAVASRRPGTLPSSFIEAEVSLYESAGLGHLVRLSAEPR